MKNPKIVKPLICLFGLFCFVLPFFSMNVNTTFVSYLPSGISIPMTGIELFALAQICLAAASNSIMGALGSAVDAAVVYIVLLIAWLAVPFLLMGMTGVWNLLRQDRITRIVTIITSAINSVIYGVTVIYLIANPISISDVSLSGSVGLWLLLVVNIVMLVLGIYQKNEEAGSRIIDSGSNAVSAASPDLASSAETGELVGINGQYSGSSIKIEAKGELVIGRDATSCNLIVSGAKVSRRHCAVKYDPASHTYRVIDYSSNGTYTSDGKRLLANQYTSLPRGTTIYLGDQSNMFRLS